MLRINANFKLAIHIPDKHACCTKSILLPMLSIIGLYVPQMFCSMLCVSRRIDILRCAEAGFKLDAHFRTFFLDKFHSLLLVPSCPFLNTLAAAALPHAPCLTVSDSACSAGHVATAAIHAAGCICGWSRDSCCRLHRRRLHL